MRTQYVQMWGPVGPHQVDLWRIYKAWVIVPPQHLPAQIEHNRVRIAPLDDENGIILDAGIWVKMDQIKERVPL